SRLPMPCVGFSVRYATKRPSGEGMESCAIAAIQTASSARHHRLIGLTRIRPNYCVFKGVFFGSNPLVECQTPQNRGHGSEFTDSAQTRQSETARANAWDKIEWEKLWTRRSSSLRNFGLFCVLIEELRRESRSRRFSLKWK